MPIWQKGIIRLCATQDFDVMVFTGEMYCLSTWIASVISHIRKKDVIFWGHGVYGNEHAAKLFFRKLFLGLANKHILYERRAKKLMTNLGFSPGKLYVVFNSLDYDKHKSLRDSFIKLTKSLVFPFFKMPEHPVIVFIGRLTKEKKLGLLIESMNELAEEGMHVNLMIIGEGAEKEKLKRLASTGLSEMRMFFFGATYDEEEIGRFLSTSDLCVSPGNIGLTAIHSLSFGTPVATHNNFNMQGPEAEAISDGYNGFLFQENNKNSLKEKMLEWFLKNSADREGIRNRCYEIVDNCYNPGYQMKVIERMLENELPEV